MKILVETARKLVNLKYKLMALRIIQDIPTEQFESIIVDYLHEGWIKTYEYQGFDAWIDFGKVKLKKGSNKLVFEWDNWSEGEITGKDPELQNIALRYQLEVRTEPKWWPIK